MITTNLSVFNDLWNAMDVMCNTQAQSWGDVFPPMNLFFSEDGSFEMEMALAGYDRSELAISVDGSKLTIKGTPKEEERKGKFYRQKVKKMAFEKTYSIPTGDYDLNRTKVTFINGLLKVVLPKKEVTPEIKTLEIEG